MMGAHTPGELLSLLNDNINAGDLQATVACYEPETVFVLPEDQGGEARGREAISQVYIHFLASKPALTLNATVIVEASGQQPDGTWLYLIDNPFQPG